MDKMNLVRAKPFFHLSTFTMETSDRYDNIEKIEDDFDEEIHEYIYRIYRCSNRSQAVKLRTNAFKFIDQWRVQRLEQLDQRIRFAGQLILNAFDERQDKRQHIKCPHRSGTINPSELNESSIPTISGLLSLPTGDFLDDSHHSQKVEVSIDRLRSLSPSKEKISFNLADFIQDFTFDTLAHLSPASNDIAMIICENNTLIYSQHSNELVIVSLFNPKQIAMTQLNKNCIIRDLCYVDWLFKCLVIADEQIYLLNYRTLQCDIIDSGIGYLCGAIDNHRCIFYLVQQSTLYKYDKSALVNLKGDEYPIADGYHSQRIALDNKTNDYLALLVIDTDQKNYILVYSTKSLADGYLYKIIINDQIERQWICSNENQGWLVQGTYPGSCFDLNINRIGSIRVFNCNEIRNIISLNEYQRFIIRTNTEIFVLIKYPLVESF